MEKEKNILLAIIYILLGAALFTASQITDLGESTMAQILPGMGGALIAVGVVRLYRGIRLEKDSEYMENFEIETHDERNRYLRMKAWSWAGYSFVLIGSVATIIFAAADKKELMMLTSGSVCLVLVLYWISYLIVRNKY